MRRLAVFLLIFYAFLTVLVLARTWLGWPSLHWVAMALPLLGFVFSAAHASVQLRWTWVALFLALSISITLFLESLGVATGWIYGAYHYSNKLGPLFLGLTPYIIPLSWFMMLYPAYRMADRILPPLGSSRWLGVAALGGLIMTAWDLTLDPWMVASGHWIWETPGAYFGVPLHNYLGWWLTGFIVLACFLGIARRRLPVVEDWRFDRLAVLGYALIGLGNAMDAWMTGLTGPAWAGFLTMGGFTLLAWRRAGLRLSGSGLERHNPARQEESRENSQSL